MPTDAASRIAVALPPLDARARDRAAAQDWDVDLLDPTDPDERSVLIRLAHPQLDDAIERDEDELTVDGRAINPRLHLAIHELVATQIIDGDPIEMFDTATRLIAAGRDPHEVLHMLGLTVSDQIWTAMHDQRPYDRDAHIAALEALPVSWDALAGPPRTREPRPRRRSKRRR
ncbi:MAG: DUF1841 family protein [Solirubrobacteraceae bacterium]